MKATDADLDLIFRQARTQNGWQATPVSDDQLREIFELMKWGPTSANSSPTRLVFLRTPAARERLRAALDPANVAKTMNSPVVTIVGYDTRFYDRMPQLFPHNPTAKSWFEGEEKKALAETTAFRNSSLQGAYLIIAARAIGLECGPMSGFDNTKVDAEFFAGTSIKSNFLCSLGCGDHSKVHARGPRLAFDEACTLL